MKCIVRLCPNDDKDGTFWGPICHPCASVLRGHQFMNSPAAKRIMATVLLAGEVTS